MFDHELKLHERRRMLRSLLAGGALAIGGSVALAQDDGPNSSLYSGRPRSQVSPVAFNQGVPAPPAPLLGNSPSRGGNPAPYPPQSQTNWYETPVPPPKEVRVKDIIKIRVDIARKTTTDGNLQRRKSGRWDAVLNDWVFLNGLRGVKPAPQSNGDERIQGNVNQQYRATNTLETSESLKFEVATTVQAILPNGNLVLESHTKIRDNDETWLISLSGICRREDIQPGNTILSNDVAELFIEKKELGIIKDGYRRGFITKFLDTFSPF